MIGEVSWGHYDDVIMTTMASEITSLTVVYSTVYSDADQRKHQSSASLAFVWGIHRDRWLPRTKGQLCEKCFYLMTSSWKCTVCCAFVRFPARLDHLGCCLSCVTPPLIFHQLVSNYRLQINDKTEKNKFKYSSNPFCILKWTNWHVIVHVGWMKKVKNTVSLTASYIGFPKQHIVIVSIFFLLAA